MSSDLCVLQCGYVAYSQTIFYNPYFLKILCKMIQSKCSISARTLCLKQSILKQECANQENLLFWDLHGASMLLCPTPTQDSHTMGRKWPALQAGRVERSSPWRSILSFKSWKGSGTAKVLIICHCRLLLPHRGQSMCWSHCEMAGKFCIYSQRRENSCVKTRQWA